MLHFNDQQGFVQPDFNQKPKLNKKRFGTAVLVLFLIIIGYLSFKLETSPNTIEVQNKSVPFWQRVANIFTLASGSVDPDYIMPAQEPNRFDVLVMGIRGEDDPHAEDGGPFLTDSMMIVSYDKTTKKASMVSVPRDLYIKIGQNKKNKLNTAYEYGYYHKNGGINFTKELISRITGVYIDKAIVLDFSSFEKIIDEVGGIDITLITPFEEKQQWGYEFSLPAGLNHLDGKTALYYARSRYSSSDFDRSRRQQEVIFALKDKLTHLNFWSNPIKTLSILNSVRSNIQTDLNIWNTSELLNLAKDINSSEKVKKYVMTTDNLLYESRVNDSYVLLPKGDNFTQIKQLFQDSIK